MIAVDTAPRGIVGAVAFSDEEVWALSRIDHDDPSILFCSPSVIEHEMRCQRDMRVRGRRLWDYHRRVGDLADYLLFPRFGPPGVGYLFARSPEAVQ